MAAESRVPRNPARRARLSFSLRVAPDREVLVRDWRKAADYSFPTKFPPSRWAWEFLRRNPEYRKDWEKALARLSELDGTEDVSDVRIIVEMEEDLDSALGFQVSASKIAAKWLLHGSLINPAVDEPPHLSFNPGFGAVRFMRSGTTFKARGLDFPVVEFNLHLPLIPQIEAISQPLENAQKRMPVELRRVRNRPKLWPRYLRLLDADLDGRTAKQIADVLGAEVAEGLDEKKVWDQLEAAKKLRTPEGYQAIFLTPL